MSSALTDKEVEQYDRQIRLWGVDAQRRMRDALVMVAGLDALGTEVVKNLVLAGVSVILADGETVERARLGAAYFLNESHIGQNRAAASVAAATDLNPLVSITAIPSAPRDLSDSDLSRAALIILCGCTAEESRALAARARHLRIPVIISVTSAFNGAFFLDAGAEHSYELTRSGETGGVGGGQAREGGVITKSYRSFASASSADAVRALAVPSRHATPLAVAWTSLFCDDPTISLGDRADAAEIKETLYSLKKGLKTQVSAAAAVLGGVIVNEALKIVTRKDEPLSNFFVFDGMGGGGGRVFEL